MIQRYKNRSGFNDDWSLTHALVVDSGMEVSLQRIINEFQRRYRGDDWNGFIQEETPLIETTTLEALRQSGYVLGIVTGRPEAEARWTLDRLGWKQIFPLLIAREKQGASQQTGSISATSGAWGAARGRSEPKTRASGIPGRFG